MAKTIRVDFTEIEAGVALDGLNQAMGVLTKAGFKGQAALMAKAIYRLEQAAKHPLQEAK